MNAPRQAWNNLSELNRGILSEVDPMIQNYQKLNSKITLEYSFCQSVSDMFIPKFLSKPFWRPFEIEKQTVRTRNTWID